MKCPYRTFSTNGTDIFFWNGAESRIDVYNYDDMTFKSSFAFGHHPEEVFDLLIIKNTLYIARFKPMKFIKVYQIDAGLVDSNTVLMFKLQYGGRALEMSKSFSENILLTLIDRVMEISEKGEVIQAIDLSLPYDIRNALQINSDRFVICHSEGMLAVDNRGKVVYNYEDYKHSLSLSNPYLSSKDNYGNIVVLYNDSDFIVCDREFCLKLCSNIPDHKHVLKMCYVETRDEFLCLMKDSRLLAMEL